MALSCVELLFVEILTSYFFQQHVNARTFVVATSLSILCFLVADDREDGDEDLYEQVADSTTRLSIIWVCVSLIVAAACRAVCLVLGSALLRKLSKKQVVSVVSDDGQSCIRALALAGLSGSTLASLVDLSVNGIPPLPTGYCAACCSALLVVSPASVLVAMIALQFLPVSTVAILEVSQRLLSAIAITLVSHDEITLGQALALVLVFLGASLAFGRQLLGLPAPVKVAALD
jgi:drug/metabolite transporter (DMT)-like permease